MSNDTTAEGEGREDDMRITIIGAGTAGLVLGRCLLQRGIRATLLEKARPSTHRNSYGITLHASRYRPLLGLLGVEEDALRRRVAVDAGVGGTGRVRGHGGEEGAAFRANRNRWEAFLAEGLDIRWESEVVHVAARGEDGGGVEVTLGSGERFESRVLVGADGPHSIVRRSVSSPHAALDVLPFAVYNGKRTVSARDFEKHLAAAFAEGTVVEQKLEDALFQVSISDRNHEEVSISYTYSRPAREGRDALFRPDRPKSEAKAIPEELFEEVERSQKLLQEPLANVFDARRMRSDRLLNWMMRSLHVDGQNLGALASRGVVLLGDSVHAEPILGGHGANVAIEDGWRLAEILSQNRADGLREFYNARQQAWEMGVEDSESRISRMHSRQCQQNNL